MYSNEEKILILGSLFHDIGKFEQRCTGKKVQHAILGKEFVNDGMFKHYFEAILGESDFEKFEKVILDHHKADDNRITAIVRTADRLSASQRVEIEENEIYSNIWKHRHLCSLFSKVSLLSDIKTDSRYYRHKLLTDSYDVIIPEKISDKDINEGDYGYTENVFSQFKTDLQSILELNTKEEDFDSLINLLLLLFEKYLWCIPDFTGSEDTDISLYNHLKDTAAFSHALFLSGDRKKLNLVVGDIPGIQSYIFDVVYKKPAKILRGRSIFIQVLTRIFANKLLTGLGLSEASLVMHAGGKLYIVAPASDDFNRKFNSIVQDIEKYLFNTFKFDVSFNSAYHTFDADELKSGSITFGKIIEEASEKLIKNKNRAFEKILFKDYTNFVINEKYVADTDSDKIKCIFTGRPISSNQFKEITEDHPDEIEGTNIFKVSAQIKTEHDIGQKVTGNNLVIVIDDNLNIDPDKIFGIKEFNNSCGSEQKIIINPRLDVLLKDENLKKEVYKNARFLEVANYCSYIKKDNVMPFEDLSKCNIGAEFLTLIKGDIDNLGLIMAYGLSGNEKDMTAVSRTTTLSNHLKYFFSYFLNGFLNDWEKKAGDHKTYTIFAGGDDLMLVTTQSSAMDLIKELNSKFDEFTCCNQEVHISYSVTHFKDHTPVRIVADVAEENQEAGKRKNSDEHLKLIYSKEKTAFIKKKNKAGTMVFDTFIKNEEIDHFLKWSNKLTELAGKEKPELSSGLIRKIHTLALARAEKEEKIAEYYLKLARLTYTINRLLKDNNGSYKNRDLGAFCDKITSVADSPESLLLKDQLLAIISQTIYNLRK